MPNRLSFLLPAAAAMLGLAGIIACGPPTDSALGQGNFELVCPGSPLAYACVPTTLPTYAPNTALGPVAVGASLGLAYDPANGGTLSPIPVASPALAVSGNGSITFAQPGTYGFLVFQGNRALDFTNILAVVPDGIAFLPSPRGPFVSAAVGVGQSQSLAVFATSGGGPLPGALACTFQSSDESILSVTSSQNVATVTGLRAGKASVSAQCSQLTTETLLDVVGGTVVIEADAAADASPDALPDAGSLDDDAGDASTKDGGQ